MLVGINQHSCGHPMSLTTTYFIKRRDGRIQKMCKACQKARMRHYYREKGKVGSQIDLDKLARQVYMKEVFT